jgi:hypothetical protein
VREDGARESGVEAIHVGALDGLVGEVSQGGQLHAPPVLTLDQEDWGGGPPNLASLPDVDD